MKKIKIGIVGSESSHVLAFAKLINVDKRIKNCSIDYLWGETSESADKVSGEGNIPNIVSDPKEMIGKIDAVIIGHRHGKYHIKAASQFVEADLPMFIDKPLCCDIEEGKEFLQKCKERKIPVSSYSILPLQKSFKKFLRKLPSAGKIAAASIQGTCDIRSPYGGVYFLGVHLVEMALEAFGDKIEAVVLNDYNNKSVGQLFYQNGFVLTLNFMCNNDYKGYSVNVCGASNSFFQRIEFDENWYYTGAKNFVEMFMKGTLPKPVDSLLKPVEVLKALDLSYQKGGTCQLIEHI